MMEWFRSEEISCKPISNLDDLFEWPELKKNRRAYRTLPLTDRTDSSSSSSSSRQVLVCHDMSNNYHEDRLFQGSASTRTCYNMYHWPLVDAFIYFSHHLVTVPPESWLNAAHSNGARVLGCFITEFEHGEAVWRRLVDADQIDRLVTILIDITLFYGFDGWLLNIENKVDRPDRLLYFATRLRDELKKIDSSLYKVIWYDSVTVEGELKWQNELNEMNEPFFRATDGLSTLLDILKISFLDNSNMINQNLILYFSKSNNL